MKYLRIALFAAFEGAIYALHEELERPHRERQAREHRQFLETVVRSQNR